MTAPKPIPSGSKLDADRQASQPAAVPRLPESWTASVLLSPFGDSISPLPDPAQLIVATVECSATPAFRWMRVGLYLTQTLRYCEFLFLTRGHGELSESEWYWIDAPPKGPSNGIHGPFETTLLVPEPDFFEDAGVLWGNVYPLMCTDKNPKGVACNHLVVPTIASFNHGTWFALRQDNGGLFRILSMDATNPLMLPVLGSFYIANIPSFAGGVSDGSKALIEKIGKGDVQTGEYWNPMVTQEDIHRAIAAPLAKAPCTAEEVAAVIPGFTAMDSDKGLPEWTKRTYIEGWALGTDFIPYYTRVCYLWTDDPNSKQQSIFVGFGTVPGKGSYLQRRELCLNTQCIVQQPYYEWDAAAKSWGFKKCLPPQNPGVPLPRPDWVAHGGGRIRAQIRGNPDFGLAADETLNIIAAGSPRGRGELAIFWLWFLENGRGMLFTEGNYLNPLSHNLQLIDYSLFVQNADLTQADFENPCPAQAITAEAAPEAHSVYGHLTALV